MSAPPMPKLEDWKQGRQSFLPLRSCARDHNKACWFTQPLQFLAEDLLCWGIHFSIQQFIGKCSSAECACLAYPDKFDGKSR
jgi:hypothetical protein